MTKESTGVLLRIFVGEYDKVGHTPLYEQIVYEAKKEGLAGATVLKGVMSFGVNSRIHKSKMLAISEEMPVVIEIVDEEEKVESFLETLDQLFEKADSGGLITMEKMRIRRYGPSNQKGS